MRTKTEDPSPDPRVFVRSHPTSFWGKVRDNEKKPAFAAFLCNRPFKTGIPGFLFGVMQIHNSGKNRIAKMQTARRAFRASGRKRGDPLKS
jgi:hypothetical protein